MQELANRYQAAVGLAVRDQLDMLLIERCQGEAPVILNLNAGSRVPVATTSYGWAYLAAADPSERSTIMAQLKRANAARWKDLGTRIERAVASCARKGYAVNCGVFNPNINGVGVPLLHAGRIYCLSVAGPAMVLPHALLEREVGPRLRELGCWIAEECATQLGEKMKTWQSSIA
jgi:DNA-binding IclR family transcriptional regulator